jgi:3-dehydroquinate synthase
MSEKSAADASERNAYRQRFSVAFEYDVFFTREVFDPRNRVLLDAITRQEPARRHRLYFVVDDGVARAFPKLNESIARYCEAHAQHLERLAEPRVLPGGERVKQSPELIESLQHDLYRLGVDRQSFVVAIGGGAMLDAVGYAAATTHRGVRIVRLPTTVLGQNDSGVGVKNSVNAYGAKNFLGTFAPPFAVINDTAFLSTLEPRDQRSGMAEAVKVALIRDPVFFDWLEAQARELRAFEPKAVDYLVRRAGEIHLRHIGTAGDPFERGSARPLDFGHWAAHKLESLCDHELRHGEAVAIGMALDSRYSSMQGMLPEPELERICALLEALGFSLWHPALARLDADEQPAVLAGLREFREHLGGELTVTLLQSIGRGLEVHDMDAATVVAALRWLEARQARAGHAA